MEHRDFTLLEARVRKGPKRALVLAGAQDAHALEAVLEAEAEGIVTARLVGAREAILEAGAALGQDLAGRDIVAAATPQEAAEKAVELIREGTGDFLMKGGMETATLLRAALNAEKGIRTSSTMTHVAVLEAPAYHKLLAITDGGIIPHPTLEQKRLIVQNAVELFHRLGYARPKVALLATSETVNPKVPETLEAEALKTEAAAGFFGDCLAEGPISLDLALDAGAAEIKNYHSPVAGDADILVFPDITSGNFTAKSMIFAGKAKMAGVVLGAKVPIVLSSRGASAEEKRLSIILAAAGLEN